MQSHTFLDSKRQLLIKDTTTHFRKSSLYLRETNSLSDAIKLLSKFKNVDTIYVGFSGGKDSLVALHLAKTILRDKVKILYVRIPGNTAPENIEYVHNIADSWGIELIEIRAKKNFWNVFREKGFPHKMPSRWCLQIFKNKPIRDFFSKNRPRVLVTGVKRSDSRIRSNTVKPTQYNKYWHVLNIAPLWNWPKKAVWHYIKKHKLPLCKLYYYIYDSGNCVFCPFKTKKQMNLAFSFYPEIATIVFEMLFQVPDSKYHVGLKGSLEVQDEISKLFNKFESQDFLFEDTDWNCENPEMIYSKLGYRTSWWVFEYDT